MHFSLFFSSKKIRGLNRECPALSIEPGWHYLAIGHQGLFHDIDLASECWLLQSSTLLTAEFAFPSFILGNQKD